MSRKEEQQSNPPFEFTNRERLFEKISHVRFLALLNDERTALHTAELSENSYGEFLFVTVSRPWAETKEVLTFYGLGYHEYRERWIADVWSWYRVYEIREREKKSINREEVEQQLDYRLAEIQPHLNENTQSKRGLLYELLAEFGDEDGAIADLADLGEDAEWLLGGKDEAE